MYKRKLLFLVIALAIISLVTAYKSVVSADTIVVSFDYNLERIEKYLPSELTKNIINTSYTLEGMHAEEQISINQSILFYYDYVWTVDGVEVDLVDYIVTKDTTFVATWTPKEYKIYYSYMTEEEKTQITNLQLIDSYSIENHVVYYRPERPNYVFIDWYSSPKFNDNEICIYTDTYAIGDKVIYAKWQPIEYYINYHTDANNENNPYSYNVESVDHVLEEPVKEGHIFKGWYLDKYCTYKYDTIKHGSSGNLDLYPLWELEEYDVKYIMPDGKSQVVKVKYGSIAEPPKNINNIFELVIYDGNRNNVTSDMVINVKYVNIWYVYVIALILIISIILTIVLVTIRKRKQLHKLRYIYQSNFKRK